MSASSTLRFIVQHPLNKGGTLAGVGRFLRWQLASRLMMAPMALPFVDDLRLLVERGMTGATGNYYCGLHEAEDMAFVLHFLRPGDVFYDIGANVGSYSLLAAAAGVVEIQSFEPSELTSERYDRNMAINGLSGRVRLHRVALGAADGTVRFTRGLDATNHVVASHEATEIVETVPLRCFDAFYKPGTPSFIKMDVEGFESEVLAGSASALSDPALMAVLIEDNGSHRRYNSQGSIMAPILANGFSEYRYDPHRRVLSAPAGRRTSGNVLFLRDVKAAMDRVKSARQFKLVNGFI